MRFDLPFERTYPHPPAKVWRALTDPAALGAWLMETDFSPQVGRAFRMWCDDGQGGTDLYLCKVLELEAPHRMVWSWLLEGQEGAQETIVEFRLEALPEGTRLRLRHRGDRPADTIERFKGGWPVKLEQLERQLSNARRDPA